MELVVNGNLYKDYIKLLTRLNLQVFPVHLYKQPLLQPTLPSGRFVTLLVGSSEVSEVANYLFSAPIQEEVQSQREGICERCGSIGVVELAQETTARPSDEAYRAIQLCIQCSAQC